MTRPTSIAVLACLGIQTALLAQEGFDIRQSKILTGPIVQSLTGVPHVDACSAACYVKTGCRSFTYIPSVKTCELKGQETFQAPDYAGYISGVAKGNSASGAGFYMLVVGDPQHPRTVGKFDVKESRYLQGQVIQTRSNIADMDECVRLCLKDYDDAPKVTDKVCTAFTYIPAKKVCEFKSTKAFVAQGLAGYTSGIKADIFNNPLSEAQNRNFVSSARKLTAELGQQNVRGLVINGDLTEFGQDWELAKYKELYNPTTLPMTIYPGLGNHDFNNNVTDEKQDGCPEQSCPNRMVLFLRDEVRKLKPIGFDYSEKIGENQFPAPLRNTYQGSMAYSWDINNVHFVQLNYYPGYQRDWSAYVSSVTPDGSAGARTFAFNIRPAFDWLAQDLSKARQEGKAIILNFHDPSNIWTASDLKQFERILSDFSVSAVFVGHHHSYVGTSVVNDSRIYTAGESYKPTLSAAGFDQFYGSGAGKTPWFYSGSPIFNTYLLVNFTVGNTMTVERVFSTDGNVDRMDKAAPIVVPLKTPKANVPYTLPSADSKSVKFFNQSGFAARMKVRYTYREKDQEADTGVVLTGATAKVQVPTGSYGIVASVYAYTAWDVLSWLDGKMPGTAAGLNPDAWRLLGASAPGDNACFKTFGTILNAQWNVDCK